MFKFGQQLLEVGSSGQKSIFLKKHESSRSQYKLNPIKANKYKNIQYFPHSLEQLL